MKPRTVIHKHKKPYDLDFWKLCSLKLSFLWGFPTIFHPGDLVTARETGRFTLYPESWYIWKYGWKDCGNQTS